MTSEIQIKNLKESILNLKKEISKLLEDNSDRQVKDSLYKLDIKYETIINNEDIDISALNKIKEELIFLSKTLLKIENESIKKNIAETTNITEQIKKDLDDANQTIKLLRDGQYLKTKEELIDAFSKSINYQKKKFNRDVRIYTTLFIVSLILISVALITSFTNSTFHAFPWYNSWGIRLSIILPSLAIVSFIYFNYKLSKIQLIRYSHIHDLVDCGYEYFRFVLNDEQISSEYMKRILDNFLELKELSVIVKNEKNPTEKYLKEILKTIKGMKTKSFKS